jgi:hypothetical protein
MDFSSRFCRGIWTAVLILLVASPLSAQIEDHLSAYTGKNAEGYLDPLVSAVGTSLNSGLFRSAHIPKTGFTFAIEFPIVATYFTDDDKTFRATTEGGFTPEQTVDASTVVGPTGVVIVDGDGGTSFAFPGGFDLGSFAIIAPQIRVGSVHGTEAMLRFFAAKFGDTELGDLMLAGFGVRHNISQYMGATPQFDMAASFFWQQFKLGENESGSDLTKTTTYSLGVQGSKHFPPIFTPYTGLYYNSYKVDVEYESDASGETETIDLSFDEGYVQWAIGIEFNLSVLNLFGEYNLARRSSFAFGLGLGF